MTDFNKEAKKQLGSKDPLKVLDQWLEQALKIKVYAHSWPMVLSTANKKFVNSRIVLLKEFNRGYLIFYTNYLSQKGREIANKAQAAFNFYWPQLKKQVRGQGNLKKTSRHKSVLYWNTRDRKSQISQWLSQQSQTVKDRKTLISLKKQTEKNFEGKVIPCPKHWGGYELKIQSLEFWIEGQHRLHDRFLFEKIGKIWKVKRLFP